jgi:hypothetical protein|eukprot:COSAG01_NODE_15495_length_1331_cov_1.251623_2_plen_70_part_00
MLLLMAGNTTMAIGPLLPHSRHQQHCELTALTVVAIVLLATEVVNAAQVLREGCVSHLHDHRAHKPLGW